MAKPALRAAARELRASGCTYDEIAERLGVSKSSVSLWVRDVPYTPDPVRRARIDAHVRAMAEVRWGEHRVARDRRRDLTRGIAAASVPELSRDELLRLGALIYWCEGGKTKPWAEHRARIDFINSDPVLIDIFLAFLRVAGVAADRLRFRVSIHESADVDGAVTWWAQRVGVPASSFQPPVLKRHNPLTVRKNTGLDYRGCLVVRVNRSRELYWMIEGLVNGVYRAVLDVFTGPVGDERPQVE